MKIAFFGTPDDAVPPLRALAARDEIVLVVTQPDRRRRRGGGESPSPVKAAARELGLMVRTPGRAGDVVDDVGASGAEVGVVVAFGQLLPPALLAALPLGFVNVHFSLLPRWRGAAPVERAILAGEDETGVCVMRLDEGMDTGPVFRCERTPIERTETAGELRDRLGEMGTALLLDVLPLVGTTEPHPQVGEATFAPKLEVDEFQLDPNRAALELERLVRAGNPRPGAWMIVDGRRIRVLRARATEAAHPPGTISPVAELGTAAGALRLDEVQPEGRRRMSGDAWLAGHRGQLLRVDNA
ncbi:MAG: methionyl-tRNA formyltransferase [Acidimicrobiia bacterium]